MENHPGLVRRFSQVGNHHAARFEYWRSIPVFFPITLWYLPVDRVIWWITRWLTVFQWYLLMVITNSLFLKMVIYSGIHPSYMVDLSIDVSTFTRGYLPIIPQLYVHKIHSDPHQLRRSKNKKGLLQFGLHHAGQRQEKEHRETGLGAAHA